MRPRYPAPAFSSGGEQWPWRDALLAACLWGAWDGLEHAARTPLPGEHAVPHEQVEPLSREFRYARRLLSADELSAWLARWGLERDEWAAWLRARALGAEHDDGALTAEGLWLEAVCSGALEQLAQALAARVAARAWAAEQPGGQAGVHRAPLAIRAEAALPGPEALAAMGVDRVAAAARLAELVRAEEAFLDLCAAAVTERAVEREIAAHAVDWLRVDCELVVLASEDAAREVALSVREDGGGLGEVAARAGVRAQPAGLYAEQLDADLGGALVSAAPGTLVGPLPAGEGGFGLFLVREKVTPTAADPAIRERAEEAVRTRAVDREVAERVRWHDGV